MNIKQVAGFLMASSPLTGFAIIAGIVAGWQGLLMAIGAIAFSSVMAFVVVSGCRLME